MDEDDLEIGNVVFVDGKLYIYNKSNILIAICNEQEYDRLKDVFVG